MANELTKIRQMLHTVRSQLKSDLSDMAEDVFAVAQSVASHDAVAV